MRSQGTHVRQIASPSKWPRSSRWPGIAYSWEGPAWVSCQLALRGLIPTTRIVRAIRALAKGSPLAQDTSPLIGSGGCPTVLSLAAVIEPSCRQCFKSSVRIWCERLACAQERDVMRGAAGAYLAAAEISGTHSDALPRHVVKRLHSLNKDWLSSLLLKSESEPIQLGFAHGLAGVLFALENGEAAFGQRFGTRLRDRSLDVLERSKLALQGARKATCYWGQYSSDSALNAHGWCHGAPGIALSLLGG